MFPKYYPFDRHGCFWTISYKNINHKSTISSFTYGPLTNQFHGEWNILGAFLASSGLTLISQSNEAPFHFNFRLYLPFEIYSQKGPTIRSYDPLPEYLYPGMQVPQTRLHDIETYGIGELPKLIHCYCQSDKSLLNANLKRLCSIRLFLCC